MTGFRYGYMTYLFSGTLMWMYTFEQGKIKGYRKCLRVFFTIYIYTNVTELAYHLTVTL